MNQKHVTIGSIICMVSLVGLFIVSANAPIPTPTTLTYNPVSLNQGGIGDILDLTVKQFVSGEWVTRGVVGDDGFSITLQPDQPTNLTLRVRIFLPYAESAEQAITNTRVYISISDEVFNALMEGKSAYGADVYIVTHSYYWADGPADGIDYPTTFDYQVYY